LRGIPPDAEKVSKPYYGWWVLATLFLSGFMVYGGGLYSFVLFITPWTQEFGWNRATTAGLVSAFYFSAPFILLGAYATKRFGAVRLLTAGIILEAISVCLLPLTNALWQMYALRVLMGFGKVMFGICVPVVLAIWFRRRLSFALAIAWSGWNLGGLILGPVSSAIMEHSGWRTTCVAIGVGLVLFAVVPPLWVMRVRSPAELGLGRDGLPEEQRIATDATETIDGAPAGNGREPADRVLLRSGAFWLIALATAAFYTALAGVMTHQAALIESAGYSARIAAVVLGSTAGFAALSGPLFGWLLDRGQLLRTGALMHVLLLGSVSLLSFVAHTQSIGALLLYAVVFGLTLGGSDVSWVALMRRRFPEQSVARTYSAWYFVEIATLGLAPVGVGGLFDLTGSYSRTMLFLIVPVVVSILCLMLNTETRHRIRLVRL
jgi:OFA family oxalate/formate antiporter-like MFS transporter